VFTRVCASDCYRPDKTGNSTPPLSKLNWISDMNVQLTYLPKSSRTYRLPFTSFPKVCLAVTSHLQRSHALTNLCLAPKDLRPAISIQSVPKDVLRAANIKIISLITWNYHLHRYDTASVSLTAADGGQFHRLTDRLATDRSFCKVEEIVVGLKCVSWTSVTAFAFLQSVMINVCTIGSTLHLRYISIEQCFNCEGPDRVKTDKRLVSI
jgi:hypothetical protein